MMDISKNWAVLFPPGSQTVKRAAEDLARYLGLLAGREDASLLIDASTLAPPRDVPVIILNCESMEVPGGAVDYRSPGGRGFFWRAVESRVEIFGQDEGGLCKGIYDFLSALGIKWPEPASPRDSFSGEILPPPERDSIYPLWISQSRTFTGGGIPPGQWKRLVIPEKSQTLKVPKKRSALMSWAIRNGFDALVFPFDCPEGAAKEAELHGLVPEAGGWFLSRLLPRSRFLFHRELFRMEGGKRRKRIHFCATNPDTIAILRAEGKRRVAAAERIRLFHFWPEKGEEGTWCACPSCRAFSQTEQYRIAVNSVGDALAEVFRDGFVSLLAGSGEEGDIPLRSNVLKINPQGLVTLRW